MQHNGAVNIAEFSLDGTRVVTSSNDNTARQWIAPPKAGSIIATACELLGNHEVAGLSTLYGIAVEDAICVNGSPDPDPHRMIDR